MEHQAHRQTREWFVKLAARHMHYAATPNPSLKRSANGRPPVLGYCRTVLRTQVHGTAILTHEGYSRDGPSDRGTDES